jgi:hypothetical protein
MFIFSVDNYFEREFLRLQLFVNIKGNNSQDCFFFFEKYGPEIRMDLILHLTGSPTCSDV